MRIIKDKSEWEKVLKNFEEVDVFYTYDFMKINCIIEPGYPEAIYYEDENLRFFYPYIRRPLSKLPYVPDKYRDYSDITAPYGAGGPLFEGDVKKILLKIKEFFMDSKTVSEFVRFHPLIENYRKLEDFYKLIKISPIVYVDFTDFEKEDEILKSLRKGHRADIKYAIKQGYYLRKGESIDDVKRFYEDYINTMKVNKSDKRHFFSFRFFESLYHLNESILYLVFHEDKILCSAFFLLYFPYATYFFSSRSKNTSRGDNHFMLWSFMKEVYRNKFKFFMLGGGVNAEDSLLHFKRGFSKKEKLYFISKKIYFKKIYEDLIEEFLKYKKVKERPLLFPQYREI